MTVLIDNIDAIKNLAGTDLGFSHWILIDQKRIDTFGDSTEDHSWIHCDPVRAKKENAFGLGKTIAHGDLTLSLMAGLLCHETGLIHITIPALNYGCGKVRWPAMVPVDSRVRLGATIGAVTAVKGGYDVHFDCVIELEGSDKPACIADIIFRVFG